MYELVEKENVMEEMGSGSEMYVVDIPTRRVIACLDMTLSAVKSFLDKPETMFFKKVET